MDLLILILFWLSGGVISIVLTIILDCWENRNLEYYNPLNDSLSDSNWVTALLASSYIGTLTVLFIIAYRIGGYYIKRCFDNMRNPFYQARNLKKLKPEEMETIRKITERLRKM